GPGGLNRPVPVADGRGLQVGVLADVEAHEGAGAVAEQTRRPAGHRDQAGAQEIPLLLPDADADDDDDAHDDPGEEDCDGDGDDDVSHGDLLTSSRWWVPWPDPAALARDERHIRLVARWR